jgi:hypothetical protein
MESPGYPEGVWRELRRIAAEWAARGRPASAPPCKAGADGRRPQAYPSFRNAPAPHLEQLAEYHGGLARKKLARYAEEPTPWLARKVAEHMLFANLARQLFNERTGRPPLEGLPFPLPA